jgi:hypothetical protein
MPMQPHSPSSDLRYRLESARFAVLGRSLSALETNKSGFTEALESVVAQLDSKVEQVLNQLEVGQLLPAMDQFCGHAKTLAALCAHRLDAPYLLEPVRVASEQLQALCTAASKNTQALLQFLGQAPGLAQEMATRSRVMVERFEREVGAPQPVQVAASYANAPAQR